MKKAILVLFVASSLFSQEKVIKVEYSFLYDINREIFYKEKGVHSDTIKSYLYYNDNKSIFNYKLGNRYVRKKTKMKGFFKYLGSNVEISEYIEDKDTLGEYQSIDYTNKLVYERKYGLASFLYHKLKDSLFIPKWKLLGKEKEISGYKCKKAKTTYYGREYTAWYTEDIKTNKGPWKLNGLPGLIINAYSDDNKLSWTLKNIKKDTVDMDSYFQYNDTKKNDLTQFFISEKKKSLERVIKKRKDIRNRKKKGMKEDLEILKMLGSKNIEKDLEDTVPDEKYDYNVIERDYKPYKK